MNGNLDITFRPIDAWPGQRTPSPQRSPFSSPWSRTLEDLKRELRHLGAERIVIQLALRDDQIRLDGLPRSGASPSHPGVIIAFDSTYGPLKYATDRFRNYEDNIRAIALGLESLRRVDRYGITKRGEQYTGWKQLTAGPASDPSMVERGRRLIAEHGGDVKAAQKATHPDRNPDVDPDDFIAITAAEEAGGR